MVLPEGFALPPLFYLVPVLLVLLGVVALLWALEPPITDRTVVAFAPWMMFGSVLHVLHKIDAFPDSIAPLFGSPTVYLTTAIVAGGVWILGSFLYAGGLQQSIARVVGISGTGFFVVFAMFALLLGWERGALDPFWPVIAVVVAGIVAALAWLALGLWATEVAAVTSLTGALVVFGHALDGVSTAIGYDVIGVTEEVPASRLVLEAGEWLPTAEYIGAGWLFVLAKVALALVVVGLFTDFVREEPRRARLLLGLVAAVGLGPGTHNVLLFAVATVS